MSSLDEKRVYADRTGATAAFVAAAAGLVRVTVSGELVGEFGLARRCTARDVAAAPAAAGDPAEPERATGTLAVATDEDVLVGPPGELRETGFGPATAVDVHDAPVAAGDGRVARYADGAWETLGEVPDVRAIDGDLLAAAGGVFRTNGTHVGLADARDVTAAGTPRAATAGGLYRLGNGWMDELDGAFRVVAADEREARGAAERQAADSPRARAHAAADALYERRDGEWRERDLPVDEPVAGVAYGEAVYAVTADGTFLVDAGEGWRTRSLGLPDVRAIAVA